MKIETLIKVKILESSSPAPKKWESLEAIKEHRPHPVGQEVSLQQYDKSHDLCQWHIHKGPYWNAVGPVFKIVAKN